MDFCEITITREPIVVPSAAADAHACGAAIDFFGIVRPTENDLPLAGIDYEVHPRLAEKQLRAIVEAAAADDPSLRACRLVHRVGFVPAGELSLFLRVTSPHRDTAYAASRSLVEALKKRAPIWKQPIFAKDAA